jgi:hypothetical protein
MSRAWSHDSTTNSSISPLTSFEVPECYADALDVIAVDPPAARQIDLFGFELIYPW